MIQVSRAKLPSAPCSWTVEAVPYCGGRDPRCLDWPAGRTVPMHCEESIVVLSRRQKHIRRKGLRANWQVPVLLALRQSCDAHPWQRTCRQETKTVQPGQYSPREYPAETSPSKPATRAGNKNTWTCYADTGQPASQPTSPVVSSHDPGAFSFAARQAGRQLASQPGSLQYTKHGSLHSS